MNRDKQGKFAHKGNSIQAVTCYIGILIVLAGIGIAWNQPQTVVGSGIVNPSQIATAKANGGLSDIDPDKDGFSGTVKLTEVSQASVSVNEHIYDGAVRFN